MNKEKMDADIEEEKDVFDLIYKLEDNPPVKEGLFAALQHLLAIIVGIITPTLIIGGVLGLGSEVPYLISMALF
ncbi:MAG: xanthine permease XanP, partial [Pseudomonadota bacterium]|nr:xanthine permease XanP [Pseudomonadota bacterium]